MNPEQIPGMVAALIIALTLVLALVLVLRRPIRLGFGAGPAYGLWLLVPAALIAVLLPNPQPSFELIQLGADVSRAAGFSFAEAAPLIAPARPWLLYVWLVGVLASCLLMMMQEWRFRSNLGSLERDSEDCWRATQSMPCPALVGLFRPRVVIPPDFEQRWNKRQRTLVLAHERAHARRGDPWANAMAAMLCALFWFHPLVWFAGRSFRADQEMACDASVLQDHPEWPRSYAEALLVPGGGSHAVACRWSNQHTMKERIKMLTRIQTLSRRRIVGLLAVGAITLGVVGAVWSAGTLGSGKEETRYFTVLSRVSMAEDERVFEHRYVLSSRPGSPFSMESELGAHGALMQTFTFTELDDGLIDLSMTISLEGDTVATPRLIFPLDHADAAAIETTDRPGNNYRLEITASSHRPQAVVQ